MKEKKTKTEECGRMLEFPFSLTLSVSQSRWNQLSREFNLKISFCLRSFCAWYNVECKSKSLHICQLHNSIFNWLKQWEWPSFAQFPVIKRIFSIFNFSFFFFQERKWTKKTCHSFTMSMSKLLMQKLG